MTDTGLYTFRNGASALDPTNLLHVRMHNSQSGAHARAMGLVGDHSGRVLATGQGHHCRADRELDGAGIRINNGKTAMARHPIRSRTAAEVLFIYY